MPPYLAGVPAATEVVQHAVDLEHFGSLITNIKLTGQRVAFSSEHRYLLQQFGFTHLSPPAGRLAAESSGLFFLAPSTASDHT